MDQKSLTREQLLNAVNLVATMAVSDLAEQQNVPPTQMLLTFMASRTASVLYDTETGLWRDGPAAVEDLFLKEFNLVRN